MFVIEKSEKNMLAIETKGRRTIFVDDETYHYGEILTDKDMVDRKRLDLLKFKYVSKGDFFTAYIIDEIEQHLKRHEDDYEYFFFMLDVISEITIKRDVIVKVATLIEYITKDIESFKHDYEKAESISSFLSAVMADIEMIL